jgi:methylthioribose-1-phosphate isomerase
MKSNVVPLRWKGDIENGHVEMLDQRKLPHAEEWLSMNSAEEVARGIREMVIRGAPAIGIAAAYGVVLAAQKFSAEGHSGDVVSSLEPAFATLGEARPTAVNLKWALERMRGVLEDSKDFSPGVLVERLYEEAETIRCEDRENNRRLSMNGAEILPRNAGVLTHCNTGGLATGGFGTALGIIRAGVSEKKIERVWIDETRPYLQGARLTTWECLEDNLPATLITDNMAAHFMATGDVDAVVVGTDRVAANGDIANKIGTYGLAVLCDAHDIPFYVGAPVSTVDLETQNGDEIPIEQRSAREVTHIGDTSIAPEGIEVAHPAFDITPAEYIDAIVTERGVVEPPFEAALAELK